MANAFLLCDLVSKVQKCHAANREGSFNSFGPMDELFKVDGRELIIYWSETIYPANIPDTLLVIALLGGGN